MKGYQSTQLVSMADSEMFRGGGSAMPLGGGSGGTSSATSSTGGYGGHGVTGSRNNDMTDRQRQQLAQIKHRDQDIVRLYLVVTMLMIELK